MDLLNNLSGRADELVMVKLADIDGGKDREHTGLKDGDEVLKTNEGRKKTADTESSGDHGEKSKREWEGKSHTSQNVKESVAGKHVNPKSNTKRNSTESVGNGLEGNENESHGPGGATGNEMARELEASLGKTKDGGSSPDAHTEAGSETKARGGGLVERHKTEKVARDNGAEEGGSPGSDRSPLVAGINNGREQPVINRVMGLLSRILATPKTVNTSEEVSGEAASLNIPNTGHSHSLVTERNSNTAGLRKENGAAAHARELDIKGGGSGLVLIIARKGLEDRAAGVNRTIEVGTSRETTLGKVSTGTTQEGRANTAAHRHTA
uniref:Uncharacterized protein n=1 Tax=Polytomella parva TaxID=51329 RepID=A0A7S0VF63_9CHLO|mmetsp:Transcript_34609/g.62346  ORF Transcript_34609/g.62346 Transcript_34609/m.62346 type:complete len:324 (+) Transcript_34609:341-1312(+)|eukprot:CAMPEP_0175055322 /NCGR_PEP_ID=MMETSP0052_2-20121109/10013_1 /TAXON_ID=51329 ORGANISM="Polytomella parva, Strain SAG 63-3" /NCGR_SAMPLE_ID=MMETSP0052_2 /ASSEMBLY_ACC=CAM_ASM_000194 /LENGTH=323 /DNA_ID=CAMNT_0016320149 /DNA_START=269 /DNA_END=1240 /DNA_ORIENTATION=-